MQFVDALGLFAAFCITACFVPQVIKSWKTKSVKDFSWLMLIIYVIGLVAWEAYGLMISNMPLIVSDVVGIILILPIISIKLKYG